MANISLNMLVQLFFCEEKIDELLNCKYCSDLIFGKKWRLILWIDKWKFEETEVIICDSCHDRYE